MIRESLLAFQVFFAVIICCASSPAANNTLPARVLHFPKDHSMGGLHYSIRGRDTVKPAQGDVSIPSGTRVTLKVNYAGAEDLSPLAKLPPDGLQRISFRNLEIKDEQFKSIENLTGLEDIDFEETDINDQGLDHLRKLKNLTSLDFRATYVTGAQLIKLKPLTRLISLTLNNCPIGDNGLEGLAQLKSVERLYIASGQLSNIGLKKIAPMTQLVCLDISKNQKITDAGIATLVGMKKLQELRISDLPVSSACIPYLKKLPSLHRLYYNTNKLSPKILGALRQALPRCECVDQQHDVDADLFAPLH